MVCVIPVCNLLYCWKVQEQITQNSYLLHWKQEMRLSEALSLPAATSTCPPKNSPTIRAKCCSWFMQQTLWYYRDLGDLLPCANASDDPLEFLGRCDFMVKICRYSVILGAISQLTITQTTRKSIQYSWMCKVVHILGGICLSIPTHAPFFF